MTYELQTFRKDYNHMKFLKKKYFLRYLVPFCQINKNMITKSKVT